MIKRFVLSVYNRMVEWAENMYWYDGDHGTQRLTKWIVKEYLSEHNSR